ncbi:MAG TPA: biotin/lipoyl-containing protein [Bauldia sp.]|nr:biotin/lipoyl-containing protein [Bauldia sp.]
MVKLVVPSLGTEITEGVIVEWLKNVGDVVSAGEPVVVVGTPKLNLEVEAPVAGTLSARHVAVDDIVEVGALLAEIAES